MIQNNSPNLEELLEQEEGGGGGGGGGEKDVIEQQQFRQKLPINLFKRRHSVAPQHPVNSQ